MAKGVANVWMPVSDFSRSSRSSFSTTAHTYSRDSHP
jgi:hypothetical protein